MAPKAARMPAPSPRSRASSGSSSKVASVNIKTEAKEEVGDDESTSARTSSSRSRARACGAELPTPKKAKTFKIEVDEEDTQGSDTMDAQTILGDEPVECDGCHRHSVRDHAYNVMMGEIEYQYVSKNGNFCKDCHTVWRLMYKSRLTLVLFVRYLQNFENKVQFTREIISLVTLRYDNHARVTALLLVQRVDMLRFAFDLVGVPFPFFQINPLDEVDWKKSVASSLTFAEQRCNGQRQVLCLSPLTSDTFRRSPTSKALVQRNDLQQRLRPVLFTDQDEDAEWWREHMNEGLDMEEAPEAVRQVKTEEENNEPQGTEAGEVQEVIVSVSQKKYKNAKDIAVMSLHDYTADSWDQLKEKFIGKQIAKVLKFQHEIVSGPDAQAWGQKVAILVNGLTSGKKTLQPLLQYSRSYSTARLADFHAAAANMRIMFNDLGLSFGPKLRCLLWRADFEHAARESAESAATRMVNDEPELYKLFDGDGAKVHDLVSDCITNAIGSYLASEKDKNNEAVLSVWFGMVEKLEASMQGMQCSKAGGFLSVLRDAKIILEAATPETKVAPGHLAAAKGRLSEGEGTKVWTLWFGSSAGTVVLADSDMLLVASALDEECYENFCMIGKILMEAGMPSLIDERLVGNWDLFASGQAGVLFQDAVKQLGTAMKSWSPAGLEEHNEEVDGTFHRLSLVVEFVDEAATHGIVCMWAELLATWQEHFGKMTGQEPMPWVPQEMADEARKLDPDLTLESELLVMKAAKQALQHTQFMPKNTEGSRSAIDALTQGLARMEANHAWRSFLLHECCDLVALVADSFDAIPTEFNAMLSDYYENPDGSVLGVALAIHDRRACQKDGIAYSPGTEKVFFLKGEPLETVEMDRQDVHDLIEMSWKHASVRFYVDTLFKANFQVTLTAFWSSVAFMVDARSLPEATEQTLDNILVTFFSGQQQEALATEVSNAFGDAGSLVSALNGLSSSSKYKLCTLFLQTFTDNVQIPGMYEGCISSPEVLHCLFEYLHGMGTVFALACYLQVKHLQHKSFTVTSSAAKQQMASLTVDSKLKEVFEYFDTELRRLSADLDKHRASFDKVVGLTVGPSCLAACLDACERFAQKASDRVWQGLGEKVDELSAACESLSPRWTHIIGEDQYLSSLAKRQLLKAPGRAKLPQTSYKLSTLLEGTTLLPWLKPPASDISTGLSDTWANAGAVYGMASLAIAVMAACNILEEFTGAPEQPRMAKEFMARPRPKSFPKILETKLEEHARRC